RRIAIIAAITLNLLAFPCHSEGGQSPSGYSSYRVRLEVTRNGRPVCAQDTTVAAGESLEVPRPSGDEELRVLQRVTKFPGAAGSRALLEVQVFADDGREQWPVVSPTLGLELGAPEVYEVRTGHGLVRIKAVVEGATEDVRPADDGVLFETMPMDPSGL
ncbi:MAG TPA: hypothetical protein VJM11_21015, partial [Nevskiaceae bacterium]|nr:hypothetical protein [Nevskiaceae bacterium]